MTGYNLLAILLLLLPVAVHGHCPSIIPKREVEGILEVHNSLRTSISNGEFVAKGQKVLAAKEPIANLTWDCSLEKEAQEWSDKCNFVQVEPHDQGENMYSYRSVTEGSINGHGKAASEYWAEEFQQFGFQGVEFNVAVFNTGISHASQMIWASTTRIGCGMTLCDSSHQVIVVCRYLRKGNIFGANIYQPEISMGLNSTSKVTKK